MADNPYTYPRTWLQSLPSLLLRPGSSICADPRRSKATRRLRASPRKASARLHTKGLEIIPISNPFVLSHVLLNGAVPRQGAYHPSWALLQSFRFPRPPQVAVLKLLHMFLQDKVQKTA